MEVNIATSDAMPIAAAQLIVSREELRSE